MYVPYDSKNSTAQLMTLGFRNRRQLKCTQSYIKKSFHGVILKQSQRLRKYWYQSTNDYNVKIDKNYYTRASFKIKNKEHKTWVRIIFLFYSWISVFIFIGSVVLTSSRSFLWHLMRFHSNFRGWSFPKEPLDSGHVLVIVQVQSSAVSPWCAEAWRRSLCTGPSPRWTPAWNWTRSAPRAPACRAPWPADTGSRTRTFASRPAPAPCPPRASLVEAERQSVPPASG